MSAVTFPSTTSVAAGYIHQPTTKQVVIDYAQVVALYLQKPFHFATQPILRSVGTAIRPGQGGNCNSYTLEVIRRIFAFTFGSCVGIFSLPLLIPGLVIDKIAQSCQETPFTHWRGTAAEKTNFLNSKFMTLNTCSLWGGLPYLFGGCRPPTERTEEIAKKIREQDPDVVVMQEMSFDPSHHLYHALKDHYAHFFTRISPNVPLMESALCIASKYPVLDAGFILFPDQSTMHRGSFWIETPSCFVFTTHLEFGADAQDKRAMQLKLIREKMTAFEKIKPCYLLGDFNLDRRDEEYQNQITTHFQDPSVLQFPELRESTSTCTDLLSTAIAGAPLPTRRWEYIDYALRLKPEEMIGHLAHVNTYDLRTPYCAATDHRGVTFQVISNT